MDGGNPSLEVLRKAFDEHGMKLTEFMEKQQQKMEELSARTMDLEQKASKRGGVITEQADDPAGALSDLLVNNEHVAAFSKKHITGTAVEVPSKFMRTKALITSNTTIVPTQRMPGIIAAPTRRIWIRDLIPNITITAGSIETLKETLFTNNAGPQYDTSSPTPGQEGALKNESQLSFELVTATPTTIAHYINASRQVLSDSAQLRGHIDRRLLYGLEIETDEQILSGNGTSGNMSGLKNQDTAFTGASTNQRPMDSIAIAFAQLIANDYMPSGAIIHPLDWYSTNFLLAKDSEGRYLLGDPGNMPEPQLWGVPVAISSAQTQGEFTVLDGQRAGYLAVREDASIRLSEHHADNFIRNLVTILAELRAILVVEQSAAIISGALNTYG